MNMLSAISAGTLTIALAGTGLLASGGAASASHGGDDVRTSGTCSMGATWKLKVKSDNGALEVEGEVDSNVVGQTWAWSIRDNGTLAAKGMATTIAPSGSFSVGRLIADKAGTDTITFRATNAGQVCRGTIAY